MARKKKQPTVTELLEQLAEVVRETALDECTKPEHSYVNILKAWPEMGAMKREQFVVLGLDARRRVIYSDLVSLGTLTATLVHPRNIFLKAITESASSIVVGHNHPSGDPSPSHEDRLLTERLAQAGRLLGINVDDHIIIGKGTYVSMRRLGLLVA